MIVLLIAILNTIRWLVVYDAISMKFVIFLIVILALVALSRHAYYRDRLAFSWGQTLWVSCVYVVTFILYTIVGVYNAPQIHHRHAVPEALFFPSQKALVIWGDWVSLSGNDFDYYVPLLCEWL